MIFQLKDEIIYQDVEHIVVATVYHSDKDRRSYLVKICSGVKYDGGQFPLSVGWFDSIRKVEAEGQSTYIVDKKAMKLGEKYIWLSGSDVYSKYLEAEMEIKREIGI